MAQKTATGPALDQAWLDDFMDRWTDAWASHKAENLLALMTDDVVYDDAAWPTTMRGHADVREFLEHTWRAMPDVTFETIDGPYVHPTEEKAAFYWRGTGTHTGPVDPPGLAPTGKSVEFYGADFHEYRDGKVARLRIVFDMNDLLRQLGVLPPPGGRQERVMAKLTNLKGRLPGG